jgi:tetratricopeptide (TPR) repeat protein
MLFDLRGRGRRRTIQGIYLVLALLMGGGLIFFGVGGTGVGLFNSDQDGGGASSTNLQAEAVASAEKRVKATPENPAAWAALARARINRANDFSNANSTSFSKKGLDQLRKADQAYARYLALKPKKAEPQLARRMANIYDQTALNQPAKAVKAWEVVVDDDPSRNSYSNLAITAYLAKQARKGDLASAQAVRLTPKEDRPQLRSQLKAAKDAAKEASAQGGQPAVPSG